MKIKHTLDDLSGCMNIIYLAGPTQRIDGASKEYPRSYRNDIVEQLSNLGFKGTVVVPEYRDNIVPVGWSYNKQILWEIDAMSQASKILFWVPRDLTTMPAFTTNIEFGEWLSSGKVIVGAPEGTPKTRYMMERIDLKDGGWHTSIEELCKEALSFFDKRHNTFFTADTHFSQERTLKLSLRPFQDTLEMDNALVSNWNKNITSNDIVYHLGDVGNYEVIRKLNFSTLYILKGNYEAADCVKEGRTGDMDFPSKLHEVAQSYVTDDQDYTTIKFLPGYSELAYTRDRCGNEYDLELTHEPSSSAMFAGKAYPKNFCLFGHIHMNMVKENMLNVGVDLHNFSPIDLETVLFYKNAIENHYDEEVFM